MGLKNFLKEQGFITDDEKDPKEKSSDKSKKAGDDEPVEPTYFPITSIPEATAATASSGDPSFVAPLKDAPRDSVSGSAPDPAFVKFFENEMAKANLPGPDYFEFRQSLIKTQQKMASKGVVAPEVVLQAVLTSFEAQDIPPTKLIENARHYKEVMRQKNDDFIAGAENEKNSQLEKRQDALQAHSQNIKNLESQLDQIERQRTQISEALKKEKTQMEVDKSLGQEGIEKIERAQRLIGIAHRYMQSVIDADIKNLQSL